MAIDNFKFLQSDCEDLASLAGFAETYAHTDPVGALVKLRSFAEQMARFVHHRLGLAKLYRPTLLDQLNDESFRHVVPDVVLNELHRLRIEGNHAVHEGLGNTETVLELLRSAFDLSCWLTLTFLEAPASGFPSFEAPPAPQTSEETEETHDRELQRQIASQEERMQQLISELEATRKEQPAPSVDPDAVRESAHGSASSLDFNEQDTRRRLIDGLLISAGWNVGSGGTSTQEVGQEVEIPHQPTETGIGFADYVLYDDDGKPLAVIEAKRTSRNPEEGRAQAEHYAHGLEREYGQRPMIFYTNGHELWHWNDARNEPPRKLFDYFTKDTLQFRIGQRTRCRPLGEIGGNPQIAGRHYQLECVKRVISHFSQKRRKSLIVQATGTGKTRVAISLCDALIRAREVRRVLFLCDRRELRRQARDAFQDHMDEPCTYVTRETCDDRNSRIYLATYPAMMQYFRKFGPGFFDLVIADESHRSIYNRYRHLFSYFDALQVGLTATPVDHVSKNTFKTFGCETEDPTFNYGYEEAINDPLGPFLVPFDVEVVTTEFLREGIRYREMSPDQRAELDEDEEFAEQIDFNPKSIDKQVYNKDTNRFIIRNLMEHGLKAEGDTPGKTIVFARNHDHAILLQNLFDEMYPQYGGNFCRVIDTYDSRAEELILDFKGTGKNPELTIAISVDMLDTGIDVPEIVNLVFAKPVFSFVKFWQMIGRGTRLCPDLHGPGQHKTQFRIFDHWKNFEWFDEHYAGAQITETRSLAQQVFESRIELADQALQGQSLEAFQLAIDLLAADIAALPMDSIPVREKWQYVESVRPREVLERFEPEIQAVLREQIAPLMQWRDMRGHEAAGRFDRLVCQLQAAHLQGSSQFENLRDELLNQVSLVGTRINLSQVRVKQPVIERVQGQEFWDQCDTGSLEDVRQELRGIMRFRPTPDRDRVPARVLDVSEDQSLVERQSYEPALEGLELVAYTNRVQNALNRLFEENGTLQKIRQGKPVTEDDLQDLVSLVLTQEPGLDLSDLAEYYPKTAGQLDLAIRSIIGMDPEVVREKFEAFRNNHPGLTGDQIRFLTMLETQLASFGLLHPERLIQRPFTSIHSQGIYGVFNDEKLRDQLLDFVGSFSGTPGK
jgi:type I restriction enzyme R subunit